jgi:hypothetical protein
MMSTEEQCQTKPGDGGPGSVTPRAVPQTGGVLAAQPGAREAGLAATPLLDLYARAFALDQPGVLFGPDTLASFAGHDALCSRLFDLNTAEHMTTLAHPKTFQFLATFHPLFPA